MQVNLPSFPSNTSCPAALLNPLSCRPGPCRHPNPLLNLSKYPPPACQDEGYEHRWGKIKTGIDWGRPLFIIQRETKNLKRLHAMLVEYCQHTFRSWILDGYFAMYPQRGCLSCKIYIDRRRDCQVACSMVDMWQEWLSGVKKKGGTKEMKTQPTFPWKAAHSNVCRTPLRRHTTREEIKNVVSIKPAIRKRASSTFGLLSLPNEIRLHL